MKVAAILVTIALTIWTAVAIGILIIGRYEYSNQIESYWNLADRASTISQKSEYVDKFIATIEKARLSTHNAIFLKTPDNSLEQNMRALLSLQSRLHEIQTMDVKSFEYQQAIYQITAQEQGEAHKMLGVIGGCWWKENHFFFWDWIGLIHVFLWLAGIALLFFVWIVAIDGF